MGCTPSPYLIDWLTLKLPISATAYPSLFAKMLAFQGHLGAWNSDGEMTWQKKTLDIDALRTDSPGLFWQLSGDGTSDTLIIGASPASLEHGLNMWGSIDINHCADVIISHAQKALSCLLPPRDAWQVRRIDVTANYALPDAASVKTVLEQLLVTPGARRRPASGKGAGDTDYWNMTSDLSKGKAYHKGPQVSHLIRKNKLGATVEPVTPEHLELLDRVLRLEHTRGARWFRRLAENGHRWQDLTPSKLIDLHTEFFSPIIGTGIEVKNMERPHIIAAIMTASKCTENQARAAFNTYRNCRDDGFTQTKEFMVPRTFYLHQKLLREAGISDAHLRTAKLIPFPRVRFQLASPVGNWEDIRRAA